MKKIIILVMSCNKERYINEEEVIRNTWGKDVLNKKYKNIEIIFYRGGANKIEFNNNILFLTSNDELKGTLNKTQDALFWCLTNRDFDYIVRTNTSTFVNIEAIKQFLEFEDISDTTMYGPCINIDLYNKHMFLPGYFLIIPKLVANILIKYKLNLVDDVGFGEILLYHFQRSFINHILEVTGINDINEINSSDLSKVYFVRIKDKLNLNNNKVNMENTFSIFNNVITDVNPPHKFTKIVTSYGVIPI